MAIFTKGILFVSIMLLTSCSFIIYQPDKFLHAHPDQFQTKFNNFTFSSLDGTKLSGMKLFAKSGKAKHLLIYFHGNAQNLTAHFMNTIWMMNHDYDVLIFDYRGYGLSEGEPEPRGVYEDSLAFLNYSFAEYKKLGYEKFIVYGQSLGGSIVMRALEDFKERESIHLLVLDSTFLSPREVAREKTFFPLSLIISNSYTADPKLSHLTMPVLMIHSKLDHVIDYSLGQMLSEKIQSAKKKDFWTLESPGHGNVFYVEERRYQKLFLDYIQGL
jgi:pimeloyl-ACP methyl ester carboxylesterase